MAKLKHVNSNYQTIATKKQKQNNKIWLGHFNIVTQKIIRNHSENELLDESKSKQLTLNV